MPMEVHYLATEHREARLIVESDLLEYRRKSFLSYLEVLS